MQWLRGKRSKPGAAGDLAPSSSPLAAPPTLQRRVSWAATEAEAPPAGTFAPRNNKHIPDGVPSSPSILRNRTRPDVDSIAAAGLASTSSAAEDDDHRDYASRIRADAAERKAMAAARAEAQRLAPQSAGEAHPQATTAENDERARADSAAGVVVEVRPRWAIRRQYGIQ